MKKQLQEMVIQKFPYRCPYCDQVLSYEAYSLSVGDNEILCLFCKKKFIKVIFKDTQIFQKQRRNRTKKRNDPS